jgi:hypothetical protein
MGEGGSAEQLGSWLLNEKAGVGGFAEERKRKEEGAKNLSMPH